MIIHIKPEILGKLSILNCRPIMKRRGTTTDFSVNRGCLWPSDLVGTNYVLNVNQVHL